MIEWAMMIDDGMPTMTTTTTTIWRTLYGILYTHGIGY